MFDLIKRLLGLFGFGRRDGSRGPQADPYARKPAPRTRKPNGRAGAVAVAEPEE